MNLEKNIMGYVQPKKNLGQHFLKDEGIAGKIRSGYPISPCGNNGDIGFF